MQRPEPILVAERFPALLDALLALLESLPDDDWSRPTALPGWSVKDVVQHLLGDEMNILSGKRDRFSESRGAIIDWETLVAFINERNRVWVEATRRLSPRLLRELLRFTGEQANAFFQSLDPFQMGGPVNWVGPEPAPVWLDVAREFTERWHHQQHLREAVGRPGALEPYFLQPVLAAFVRALPRAYADVAAREGTAVMLEIHGPSGDAWTVLRERDGWQLFSGKPERADAQIVMGEDTAWRLFTKGIGPVEAREKAALRGDLALAERALQAIAIIA